MQKRTFFQRSDRVHFLWHCEYSSDILLVTLPSQVSWKIHFYFYLIITKLLFSVKSTHAKGALFGDILINRCLSNKLVTLCLSHKTVLGNVFCSPKKIHYLWDSPDFSQGLASHCKAETIGREVFLSANEKARHI